MYELVRAVAARNLHARFRARVASRYRTADTYRRLQTLETCTRPCVVNTIRSCLTAACERAYIIQRRQVSLSVRSLAKSSSPPP